MSDLIFVEGKVEYQPKTVKENEEGKHFSLKLQDNPTWFKVFGDDAALKEMMAKLTKGTAVEFEAEDGTWKVKEFKTIQTQEKEKSGDFTDDLISFEELLDDAHTKGLFGIETELINHDAEKKAAIFKATAIMQNKEGTLKRFEAYGDADQTNCQSQMIKPHYIRMAETRAIARALRWATNNAATSEEETDKGTLPENKAPEKKTPEKETPKK